MADQPLVLLLWVPEGGRVGSSMKLLATARSEEEAQQRLDSLDASVTGTVAVATVTEVYDRRPAITNVPVEAPTFEGG